MYKLLKQNTATAHPTVIALLRHGRTLWNEEGKIQGLSDSPLSLLGKSQVTEWQSFLRSRQVDHIFASDLGRVRETVAILQKSCPTARIHWIYALREQHWGDWQGRTLNKLKETDGKTLHRQVRAGWDFCPPHGESRREVLQRILPVFSRILQQFSGERILMICHEGIIKAILYHLADRRFLPEEEQLLKKNRLHLLVGDGKKLQLGPLNISSSKGACDTP